MNDVARAAGVSQATVSFVLNDRRDIPVAPATRQRVLEAASTLRYRTDRRAQELRIGRSTTIGVVSHGVASHPFAGSILRGLQREALRRSHAVMVIDVDVEATAADVTDAVAGLVDRGVGAVVHASAGTRPVQIGDVDGAVRTAFVACWPADGSAPGEALLLPDDRGGGRAVAAHVLGLGHRSIAFLGGPARDHARRERERGLDEALGLAGLPLDSVRRFDGDYGTRSGYRLAARVLEGDDRPSALLCGNDQMALGAYLAARDLGLRVPHDLSIAGYDDQEALANQLVPELSTVALPHDALGARAAEILIGDPPPEPVTEFVECEVVVRESTSPPPLNTY
ncbi:LacI family DNA-binding transcriptional regulator [Litorihabitans aurantiacus]|uniref:LacI family transcriptional regulator n=1 Tax=Litorihabitans aurantiacus TaxID=1930061 RepID=A0AA37UWC2_9MICO|nr:LacI family DNA-binding transcriptional regulator [Litorihabitans aurantiacus]GMA30322.1 LacI family transcriptional regulator [Litorihabitans aurantiacus]